MRTLKVFILSLLLLACCSWLMVSAALAEEGGGGSHGFDGYGIIYGPTSTGVDDFGASGYKVGCYAPDRYYAAYLLCSGNNANFDVALTDEQKAFLSNADSGGAFYELAQKFQPDTMPIYVLQYGEGNTWFAEYNNHDLDDAISKLRDVINGNNDGGLVNYGLTLKAYNKGVVYSGNKGATELYHTGTFGGQLFRSFAIENSSGVIYPFSGPDITVTLVSEQAQQLLNDGLACYIVAKPNTSGTLNKTRIVGFKFDVVFTDIEPDVTVLTATDNGVTFTYKRYRFTAVDGKSLYYASNILVNTTDINFNVNTGTLSLQSNGITKTLYDTDASSAENYWVNFGYSDSPTVPPSNWPDTPDIPTPTEPDVPIHTGHGIDDLPEPSDYIEQPTYVTNVFTADLQGVIDALDEHCQHLQDAMYSNFQGYYDDITDFLSQLVQWLGSNINDMLNDLCDYLHDLFEWLADQFDYSVSGTGYNDNTVVSWLRKIYARLGGGTNTRPTDPVADPFDFGEWLSQLFGNFVGWLFGLGSDAVDGLVEDFQTLITKFPFSIPWDLGAMLALLVTAPVTPVFEFPCYAFTGTTISQVGVYLIDMSAWDDVMNTIRPMEVLVFAFWLAFKIDFFKGIVELNKN